MNNEHAAPISPAPMPAARRRAHFRTDRQNCVSSFPRRRRICALCLAAQGRRTSCSRCCWPCSSGCVPDRQIQAALPDLLPDLVFLEVPGPGGGGGGGGNKSPDPPKHGEECRR